MSTRKNWSHAIKDEIKNLALGIGIGEQVTSLLCPICSGGETHEKTFAIKRIETGLLYTCYRAKCGRAGFIPSSSLDYTPIVKKFTPRVYRRATENLTVAQAMFFYDKFGLSAEELIDNGFKYNKETDRFIMPILNYSGFEIGHMARSYSGDTPKAVAYWANDVVKLHFPIGLQVVHNTIVLVEDIISAIKVNRQVPCAALLGTGISEEMINYIARGWRNVILALDPDAIRKAMGYKRKYGLWFRNFNVCMLSNDPKDLSDEQIDEEILHWMKDTS